MLTALHNRTNESPQTRGKYLLILDKWDLFIHDTDPSEKGYSRTALENIIENASTGDENQLYVYVKRDASAKNGYVLRWGIKINIKGKMTTEQKLQFTKEHFPWIEQLIPIRTD